MTKNPITDELWNMALKELNTDEGWYLESSSDEMKIFSKTLFDEYDVSAFKASMTLKRPIETAFEAFLDHESRTKYSEFVKYTKMCYQGDGFDICYQISQPPVFFLSERELLVCRSYKKVKGGYDIVIKSTTHDDYPPNDQYARTDVIFQAAQARVNPENKDYTDIKIINQMNVGLWIPSWVIGQGIQFVSTRIIDAFEKACDYQESKKNEKK